MMQMLFLAGCHRGFDFNEIRPCCFAIICILYTYKGISHPWIAAVPGGMPGIAPAGFILAVVLGHRSHVKLRDERAPDLWAGRLRCGTAYK